MKKTITTLLATGVALCAVPAMGQAPSETVQIEPESEEQEIAPEGVADLFNDLELFQIEVPPFTPEQEARFPTAQRVAGQLMPEGAFTSVMEEMLDPLMDGMMGDFDGGPRVALAEMTGLPLSTLADVPDDAVDAAVEFLDPQREERLDAILGLTQSLMVEMGALIEPYYREGMARALAVEFTQEELAGLETFFNTPIGNRYASRQMAVFSSPYVMESMNQLGPIMGQIFPGFMERAAAIDERFGKPRPVADLPAEDVETLSEILGVPAPELLRAAQPVEVKMLPETNISEDRWPVEPE